MTNSEQKYAQLGKEALAVTWACEKFKTYITGLQVVVQTDHRPLLSLLNTKSLERLPPRIQRFRTPLMWFSYEVVFVPGSKLATADALSRAPVLATDSGRATLRNDVITRIHSGHQGIAKCRRRAYSSVW